MVREVVLSIQSFKDLLEDYGIPSDRIRLCFVRKFKDDTTGYIQAILSAPASSHILECRLPQLPVTPILLLDRGGEEEKKVMEYVEKVKADVEKTFGVKPVEGRWLP